MLNLLTIQPSKISVIFIISLQKIHVFAECPLFTWFFSLNHKKHTYKNKNPQHKIVLLKMRRLFLLFIDTKNAFKWYVLKPKYSPNWMKMNPLHKFQNWKRNNFKNQNENFYFCKATNLTNVKNSKCIRYNIN